VASEDLDRLKSVYAKLAETPAFGEDYSPFSRGRIYQVQSWERKFLSLLAKNDLTVFRGKKILDVGCGGGHLLRKFLDLGATLQDLNGIDLLSERIERARYLSPNINFEIGNAESLPYNDDFFDIACIFYVLSSIHDKQIQKNIVNEIWRVLKPNGLILFGDIRYTKPGRKGYYNAVAIGKSRLRQFFPDCKINLVPVSLSHGITKKFVKLSWILCELLEKIPPLNVSYLCVIKPGTKGQGM